MCISTIWEAGGGCLTKDRYGMLRIVNDLDQYEYS